MFVPEGGKMFGNLFKPKVTLHAVYAVAEAAGVASFSELLEKALAAGQVSEQQAAALRAKAAKNEQSANEELERAIAAANRAFNESIARVESTRTEATQKLEEAKETLGAVAEFKKVMGK